MKNDMLYFIPGRSVDNSDTISGYRLMGVNPPTEPDILPRVNFDPTISPLFLRKLKTGETLPLYAFFEVEAIPENDEIIPGLGKEVFLFEGNTKKSLIYVSCTGNYLEKQSRMRHWMKLLTGKEVEVKALTAETLTLEVLNTAVGRITHAVIGKLEEIGKYIREVTVRRRELEEKLLQFDYGDYRGFVLGGESGIGKTTLLARFAEEQMANGDVVLFYRASSLLSNDLAARMLRDLGLRDLFFEDFLQTADRLFRESGDKKRRFRLIVDAVNEHPMDVSGIVRSIDTIVHQAKDYPWFKVLASVRTAAYERLPKDARFGWTEGTHYLMAATQIGSEVIQSPVVNLHPVGSRHLEEMYEKYRIFKQREPDEPDDAGIHVFRPRTPFKALDQQQSTCAMMRNPYMMRIVLAAYNRQELPGELSYRKAMSLYLNQFVEERDVSGGGFPERRLFLNVMVRRLDAMENDTIDRDLLYEVPQLRSAMENNQRDSPYVQLIELGVLFEDWDRYQCMVRFVSDRLYEYLLSEYHFPHIKTVDDFMVQAKRAIGFKNLKGALEMILLRACEEGRWNLIIESLDQCESISIDTRDSARSEIVVDVVRDLLELLALNKDPIFDAIIERLPENPAKTDVYMLLKLFGRLFQSGETENAEKVAKIAIHEADLIGKNDLQAASRICLGRRLRRQGKLEQALSCFQKARAYTEKIQDNTLSGRLEWLIGEIYNTQGKKDNALTCFEKAYNTFFDLKMWARASSARRIQGEMAAENGDMTLAHQMLKEAFQLAQKAGSVFNEALCINRFAIWALNTGETQEAELHYKKALSLMKRHGSVSQIARIISNLGEIYSIQGKIDRAEKSLNQSLEIRKKIDQPGGIAYCLSNLSNIYLKRGNAKKAEELKLEVLSIREKIGHKERIAATLNSLASFYINKGMLDRAQEYCHRSYDIRKNMGLQGAIASTLSNLATIDMHRGNLTVAEEKAKEALSIRKALKRKPSIASIYAKLATIYIESGRLKDAERYCVEALKISEEVYRDRQVAVVLGILGACCHLQGRLKEAADFFNRQLAIIREAVSFIGLSTSLWLNTSLALDTENMDGVSEQISELDNISQQLGFPLHRARYSALKLRMAVKNGQKNEIEKSTIKMEHAYALNTGVAFIYNSPAAAYLETARYYSLQGQEDKSQMLAEKALHTVAGRPFHRLKEIQDLIR